MSIATIHLAVNVAMVRLPAIFVMLRMCLYQLPAKTETCRSVEKNALKINKGKESVQLNIM